MGIIKDWLSNFPTSLDALAQMPDLRNYWEDTRVSQIHAVRNIALALETLVGSDNLEAGSIRKRVADLEAGTTGDEKVKATTNDTTTSFLDSKIAVATGFLKSILNPGGNEQVQLAPDFGTTTGKICQGDDSRLHKQNHVAVTDPGINDDSNAGYSIGSTWTNTATEREWTCVDASVGAAVWHVLVKHNLTATTDPGTGNDNTQGYSVGSRWVNTTADTAWTCVDASTGAAVWTQGGDPSPLTTKGDLYGFDTGDARIPVGTDGQVLTADSADAQGIVWADPTGGGNVLNAGEIIEISEDQRSSDQDIDDTEDLIFPASGSKAFSVSVAGTYKVDLHGQVAVATAAASFAFRIVFDEGEAYEQVVGATDGSKDDWQLRIVTGDYVELGMTGSVELTQGSHTAKVYAKRIQGTGTGKIYGTGTAPVQPPKLVLTLPTAGALASVSHYEDLIAQIFTGTRTLTNTSYETIATGTADECSATFTVPVTGKYLFDLRTVGYCTVGAITKTFRLYIDETEYRDDSWVWRQGNVSEQESWGNTVVVELEAGEHTVEVQGKVDSNTANWNVSSVLKLSVQAVTGSGLGGTLVEQKLTTGNQTGIGTGWTVLTELVADAILLQKDDWVELKFMGILNQQASTSAGWIGFGVDDGTDDDNPAVTGMYVYESGSYNKNMSCSRFWQAPANGSYIFKVYAKATSGTVDLYHPSSFQVTRIKGGQFPIYEAGVDKGKIGGGLDIKGAFVNDSASLTDVKEIDIPSPACVPDRILVTEGQRTTTVDLTTSDTLIMPVSGSLPFTVKADGLYSFVFGAGVSNANGANLDSAYFKFVFDEGTGDEQTVGYTDSDPAIADLYQVRFHVEQYVVVTLHGEVNLSEGSHTLKAYAKEDTGSATLQLLGSSVKDSLAPYMVLQASTGSGLGGNLPDKTATASDHVISATSPAPIPSEPLTRTINTYQDEYVHVEFCGLCRSAYGAGTFYMQLRVDGAQYDVNLYRYHAIVQNGVFSYSQMVGPLDAGSHVIEVYAYRAGQNWDLKAGSYLTINQNKGGQFSCYNDGVDAGLIGAGINAVGAVFAPDTAVPNVQRLTVPSPASAPGYFYEVTEGQRTTSLEVATDTETQSWPVSGTLSFSVPADGWYHMRYERDIMIITSLASVAEKLVFDEGTADEQEIGATDGSNESWQLRDYQNGHCFSAFEDQVYLTEGSHTVKCYTKRIDGTGSWRYLGSSVAPTQAPHLIIRSVTGSSLGGTVVETDEQTNVSLPIDTDTAIHTMTVDTGPNDDVMVIFNGYAKHSTTTDPTFVMKIDIDSGTTVLGVTRHKNIASNITARDNLSFTRMIPASLLGAGTHTLKVICRPSTAGGTTENESYMQTVLIRGGTHPVALNGDIVHDKPSMTNYIGDNVSVYRNGNIVNVEPNFNSEGMEVTTAQLSANFSNVGTDWEDIDNGGGDALEVTITAKEGERCLIWLQGRCIPVAVSRSEFRFNVGGSTVPAETNPGESAAGSYSVGLGSMSPIMSPAMSAGQVTIKAQLRNAGSTTSVNAEAELVVLQFKGGYQRAENIPILQYDTVSNIDVVAAPNASPRALMALSNGERYGATLPIQVDFTDLDEGSETASTWYSVYAVPDPGVSGDFILKLSDNGPATGPTGYSVWRYLGKFWNDSSSNIRRFVQIGDQFQYDGYDSELVIYDITAGTPGTGAWVKITQADVDKAIPTDVAGEATIIGFMDTDANANVTFALEQGDPPPFTPNNRRVFMALESISGGGTKANAERTYAVGDGSFSHYYIARTAAVDLHLTVTGYRDKYLKADTAMTVVTPSDLGFEKAEGIEKYEAELAADHTSSTTDWEDVDNGSGDKLEITITDGKEGELVMLMLEGRLIMNTSSRWNYVRYVVNGTSLHDTCIEYITSANSASLGSWSPAFGTLQKGSNTIKVQTKVQFDNNTVKDDAKLTVIRWKGGYQHPENVPWIDGVSGADTYHFDPAPGADSQYRMTLSDGKQYIYDGVYNMDLSTTGLGGKESSFAFCTESTGTVDSITAPVSEIQTLTDAGATFNANMIGSIIKLDTMTSGANDGWFVVTDVPTTTTIKLWNADGVVQAGAAGNWTTIGLIPIFNYAVPNTAVPGTFGIIASRNAPDVGPADYDVYRYLGSMIYMNATDKLRPMIQYSPYGFHWTDPSEDDTDLPDALQLYYAASVSPTLDTWYHTHRNPHASATNHLRALETVVPVDVAGAVELSGVLDEASGIASMVVDTGKESWTTTGIGSAQLGVSFATAEGVLGGSNRVMQPITDKDVYFAFLEGASFGVSVWCFGFEDKYLYASQFSITTVPSRDYGEAYVTSSAATVTSDSVWTTLNATTWADGELKDFTRTNGVLKYVGAATKKFKIDANISSYVDVTDRIYFAIFKNGTTQITKSVQNQDFAATNDYEAVPVGSIVELAYNDTIEIKVKRVGAPAVSLTAGRCLIGATEV